MPYMLITLLIEEGQGEAVLSLVQEDCLSFTAAHLELPEPPALPAPPAPPVRHAHFDEMRASSYGKKKGVLRDFAERPLGEAILQHMKADLQGRISLSMAYLLAVQQGLKEKSASSYLSGLIREGRVVRLGKRSDIDPQWELVREPSTIRTKHWLDEGSAR